VINLKRICLENSILVPVEGNSDSVSHWTYGKPNLKMGIWKKVL